MTRTNRKTADTGRPGKKGDTSAGRKSQISRALSKLLRHQAENERIPISPAGWVQLDHLLAWKGLSRIGQDITVSEIFEVVEEDGRTGKGRFQVKAVEGGANEEIARSGEIYGATTGSTLNETVSGSSNTTSSVRSPLPLSTTDSTTSPGIDSSSKNTPETQLTLLHHTENPDHPPSMYLIRASQGHSMSSVQSADLLSPITLSDPSTIPDTVVHGTFYGAWPLILASGGLKSMGRNNVHFATGPALDEVLTIVGEGEGNSNPASGGMKTKSQVDSVLSENKVISGMRWDAQLLIYIDLKRCLEDVAANQLDMTWWKSGNGVILTEGVAMSDHNSEHDNPQAGSSAPPSIIASKHAKQQRATEIATSQGNTNTSMSPQLSTDVPIIASKHAKAQRAQEIQPQEASESPPQAHEQPNQPDEVIPIIVSKHAKAQYAAQQQQLQTANPPTIAQDTPTPTDNPPLLASTSAKQQFAQQQKPQVFRLVPMKYVSAVVEIKNGVGVIWRHGEGTVTELPERLRNLPVPRGKNRVHGTRGRGGKGQGKARLNVERDDHGDIQDQDVSEGI